MEYKERLGKEIIELLYENKMILTWYRDKKEGYELASGEWSPFYINLRSVSAFPEILRKIAKALSLLLEDEAGEELKDKSTSLIGLPMAGIPIATATSLNSGIPCAFMRKVEGAKDKEALESYGKHSLIEGRFNDKDNVVLVDDLISFFTSKEKYISLINHEAKRRKIEVFLKHILVLIDREQGGSSKASFKGISLISLIPFKTKGIKWLKDVLEPVEYKVIREYLNDPKGLYKNNEQREKIIKLSPL